MMGSNSSVKDLPEFGPGLLQHFRIESGYRNLNNGSFGSIPRVIQEELRRYQDQAEAKPDSFIRYELPTKIDEARKAVAELLNAPTDTVVFELNATMAVNTILRNLTWDDDCRDEILYFNSVYGACGKTIDYIIDSNAGRVASREIPIVYPCEDGEIISAFQVAIQQSKSENKRPKICLFDTVSSLPGVRFPFEKLTKECKETGVLSLVDGAQGIGMIDIDLTSLNPDFFLTNCHKWLHVPRGCAILYVPFRNQVLITSTVPTSHGYVSKSNKRFNPLPQSKKSAFVTNFEFTGTTDRAPYICVPAALKWRRDFLGGEKRVMQYTQTLAKEGGRKVARILGTEVLDNPSGTMSNCSMTNVALPLRFVDDDTLEAGGSSSELKIPAGDAQQAREWMAKTLVDDYKTFLPIFVYNNRFWTRISAQVYLDIRDFEWIGQILLELTRRAAAREYKNS
ncbi:hypothetical protein DL766_007478 [Monosporascus sp. MC13-8B]|nr:hypothetical protein DL763_010680 [Monosporascus cannonballus]RYP23644.1 hypothetical protein DL766_007478 [Monosporascus sp. MC13-8B]